MFQIRTKPEKGILLGGLVLFFCFFATSSFAASTIRGKVLDFQTQQPIPNAQVALSFISGGRVVSSAFTDSQGIYTLKNLKLPKSFGSIFTLTATKQGYAPQIITAIFKDNRSYSVNFHLKPLKPSPNRPPKITSLTPKDKSTFFSGDNITISVTASDPDRDPLQYRYFLDGKVIKDWTGSSTYSFKTTTKDLNKHLLKVEVKDPKGATDAKTITICVYLNFPKPVSQ